jgi:hypothetical protein
MSVKPSETGSLAIRVDQVPGLVNRLSGRLLYNARNLSCSTMTSMNLSLLYKRSDDLSS